MNYPTGQPFRRLAIATASAVYLLIVAGGVVRVTGSGLGCPDWPLCYGRVLPPPEITAIIEYTHRVVAAIGGALMLAMLAAAWRSYRHLRTVTGMVSVAIGLLVVQIPLGALVVALELEPLAVALHLGMAVLIFAGLLIAAVAAHLPDNVAQTRTDAPHSRYPQLLLITLAALFMLLLSGALVVGNNTQLACPDWPLCRGGLLPPPAAGPRIIIDLLHRYMTVIVSLLVAGVVVSTLRRRRFAKSMHVWAIVLAGLLTVQIAIGAILVLRYLPMVWRALHLAAASGVWAALVVLTSSALLGKATTPAHQKQAAPAPPRPH